MYVGLLILVLFLSASASGTYVINVDDFLKEIRNVTADPKDVFDIEGFLTGYGYPFENHEVTTEDGYILSLHRIPYGRNETVNEQKSITKPAVLLMHGLLSSSIGFIIFGPERSLALMLADLGYDVWLGNNRGNTWSRKHTTMDPDTNATFWDYSFHELGMYDVPATIDYIIDSTGQEKISYIGHSQGCSQFFVTSSMKPEYNEKITLMSALGPAVFMQNITSPIAQTLKNFYDLFDMVVTNLNITEFLPYSTLNPILEIICSDDSGLQEICVSVLFFIFGFDSQQLDRTTLSIVFKDIPAGSSVKVFKHFLQEVKSGHFRAFDYGEATNLEIYNNSVPLDYNLSTVSAPVAIYYGENDWLVGLPDIDRLSKALPNVEEKHLIGYPMFNHMDFISATDVVSLLYIDVINLLNSYNGKDSISTTSSRPTTKTTTTRRPTPTSITSTSDSSDGTTSLPHTTPSSASKLVNSCVGFCGLILIVLLKLVT